MKGEVSLEISILWLTFFANVFVNSFLLFFFSFFNFFFQKKENTTSYFFPGDIT